MKKFKIILCMMMWAGVLSAQTITLKDKTTSMSLPNVEVFNADKLVLVFSDNSGKADLSAFAKTDTIWFRLTGYPEVSMPVSEAIKQGIIYLNDEVITFNNFVSASSRSAQNRKEVSNKVLVLSSAQIQLQNSQTSADLLAAGGEVFIQKSQLGGGSPMIRGFATNRVLITVDGVRMNNAIFRSGNVQNIISLDPFAVSGVEVLFGPGSNIYGSDAIGGVMNFSTFRPRFSGNKKPVFSGNAVSRYASANFEKTAHLDFNVGFKRWAFLSSVSYTDFDDLLMGSFGPEEYLRNQYVVRTNGIDSVKMNPNPRIQTPTAYDQFNIMQKIAFKAGAKTEIQYAFFYSETSGFGRYDRLIRPRNNTLRSAEWNYGPQKWMMHQLQLQSRKRTAFYNSVALNAAYQKFDESRIDRDLNKPIRFTTEEQVNAVSVNLDLLKQLGRNKLFYGLEYVHNKVGSKGREFNIDNGTEKPGLSRYPDGSLWTSAALYASYSHKLNEKLTMQAGARYNLYALKSEFDTSLFKFPFQKAEIRKGALTGSYGINYRPGKNWLFTANASTGFRAPNVDDIGKIFESTPGSVIVPNPGLEAEYALNADLGVSKSIGEVFEADASLFRSRLNNAMVRRAFTFNGSDSIEYKGTLSRVEAVQNAAVANVFGFQAGFRLNLPEGFSISSRITYTKGEEELDNGDKAPLRHAPPLFGTTRLQYSVKNLKVDFYAMYNSEVMNKDLAPEEQAKDYLYAKDADGKPYSPGWLTLNVKMTYQLNSYLNLNAGIENIGDIRYRPYSSGIVAPGRNFILSLRGSF